MPLPVDRLARAGATPDELAALERLSEVEQDSIAAQLVQVAESGVRDFLDQHRARVSGPPEAVDTTEELAAGDPPPAPPETVSAPDEDPPAAKPARASK